MPLSALVLAATVMFDPHASNPLPLSRLTPTNSLCTLVVPMNSQTMVVEVKQKLNEQREMVAISVENSDGSASLIIFQASHWCARIS